MKTSCVFLLLVFLIGCSGNGGGDKRPTPAVRTMDSDPADFVRVMDETYFTADDGVHGRELWAHKPNGVIELVKDLNPGFDSTDFIWLSEFDNKLIFLSRENENSYDLWVYEDQQVKRIRRHNFEEPAVVCDDVFSLIHGLVYAFIIGETQIIEVTDGMASGSVDIGEFALDHDSIYDWAHGYYFVSMGSNKLFFELSTEDEREIWQTDGSIENTAPFLEHDAHIVALASHVYVADSNTLYFPKMEEVRGDANPYETPQSVWMWTLDSQAPKKIIPFSSTVAQLYLNESGLIIRIYLEGGEECAMYFFDTTTADRVIELENLHSIGSVGSFWKDGSDLIYTVGVMGHGSVYHVDLTAGESAIIKEGGNGFCVQNYGVINISDKIFIEENQEGHPACGIYNKISTYNPETGDEIMLVEFSSNYPYGDEAFISELIATGEGIYYLTKDYGSDIFDKTLIRGSLYFIDGSSDIIPLVVDGVHSMSWALPGYSGEVFQATGDKLYARLNNGVSGLEPWIIEGMQAEILKDINMSEMQ